MLHPPPESEITQFHCPRNTVPQLSALNQRGLNKKTSQWRPEWTTNSEAQLWFILHLHLWSGKFSPCWTTVESRLSCRFSIIKQTSRHYCTFLSCLKHTFLLQSFQESEKRNAVNTAAHFSREAPAMNKNGGIMENEPPGKAGDAQQNKDYYSPSGGTCNQKSFGVLGRLLNPSSTLVSTGAKVILI